MEKLQFEHLPAFAKFLLENKLDELVRVQLKHSREVQIPLLKLLEQMPEEQLIELSKFSTGEILKAAIQNNLSEQIEVSLKQWKENMLPVIMTREQVVVDDITLASLIRKKSMLYFMPQFTDDLALAISIVNEIDLYLQVSEAASFDTYIGIQKDFLNQSNKELEQSEDRYLKMIQEVEDYAIIRLSRDGIIENWNRGAEKIKGYVENEIVGKRFHIFYSAEDIAAGVPDRLMDEAARNGRATVEGWRIHRNGAKFWSSVALTALHNDKNEVVGFTKVTRDLTRRKRYEMELEAKSKQLAQLNESLEQKNKELERSNKELTAFSYVASHDLQEPLRKIMMFSQLLIEREGDSMSEKGKELFGKIHSGALSMKKLIEDLLSYSRVQSYTEGDTLIDLDEITREIKNGSNDDSSPNRLIINCPKLPQVKGVSFQLYQLFENIINNAVKYAKPDVPPQVDITLQTVNGKNAPFEGALADADYYKISLADNGIGFEQQYATKIFEIFQRLHRKNEYTGTGIGLAICKKIVQNHKGFIEAFGAPGIGATFIIYLPV